MNMSMTNNKRGYGLIGFVFALVCFVAYIWLGTSCTQYVVDFWVTYFRHKPFNLPFLPALVATVFLGVPSIALAIVTWIVSFIA